MRDKRIRYAMIRAICEFQISRPGLGFKYVLLLVVDVRIY